MAEGGGMSRGGLARAVTAVVASVLLAGCGGGGKGPTVSKALVQGVDKKCGHYFKPETVATALGDNEFDQAVGASRTARGRAWCSSRPSSWGTGRTGRAVRPRRCRWRSSTGRAASTRPVTPTSAAATRPPRGSPGLSGAPGSLCRLPGRASRGGPGRRQAEGVCRRGNGSAHGHRRRRGPHAEAGPRAHPPAPRGGPRRGPCQGGFPRMRRRPGPAPGPGQA